MIVFCEDCGGKNTITPDQCQNRRVVFKCHLCGYKNNYLLELGWREPKTDAAPVSYSKALSSEGALGGFVCNTKTGALKNDLKGLLGDNELLGLGTRLSQNLLECRLQLEDTSIMTFYVSGRTLVVKYIDSDSIMVVACKTKEAAARVEKIILD